MSTIRFGGREFGTYDSMWDARKGVKKREDTTLLFDRDRRPVVVNDDQVTHRSTLMALCDFLDTKNEQIRKAMGTIGPFQQDHLRGFMIFVEQKLYDRFCDPNALNTQEELDTYASEFQKALKILTE